MIMQVTMLGFVFRLLVYNILRVSLDCPYLIAPSVFSNIYCDTIVV